MKPYQSRALKTPDRLNYETASRLARLQGREGRLQEGIELIKPLYSWFSEGLDSPDLKEAREFLEGAA